MLTFRKMVFVVLGLVSIGVTAARAGDDYAIDPAHSSVTFMASHLGITYVHGRFNDFSGNFTIDKADLSKSSFALTIKVDSVDTNNKKRDEHLRSPTFFDVKQYPLLTFQSTKVKEVADGYEVSGTMNLHGTPKPMTFVLKGGKTAEFPKGVHRIGFMGSLVLKRSEFGMKEALKAIGDDVHIALGIEGVKK